MLCSMSKFSCMYEFIVPLEASYAHDHSGYWEFLTLAEISFPIAPSTQPNPRSYHLISKPSLYHHLLGSSSSPGAIRNPLESSASPQSCMGELDYRFSFHWSK